MTAQKTRMRWPITNIASGFGEYEMGMDIETEAKVSAMQAENASSNPSSKRKRHISSSCLPSSDPPLIIPEPNTPLSLPPPTIRTKRRRAQHPPPTTNRHHPHLPLKSPYLGPVGWTVPRKKAGSYLTSRMPQPFLIYQDPEYPSARPTGRAGRGRGGLCDTPLRFGGNTGVAQPMADDVVDSDEYMRQSMVVSSDDDKENVMVMSDEIAAMTVGSSRRGSRRSTPIPTPRMTSQVGGDGGGLLFPNTYTDDVERAVVDMEDGYDGQDDHVTTTATGNGGPVLGSSGMQQPILEPEVITTDQLPSPDLSAADVLASPMTPPAFRSNPLPTAYHATSLTTNMMTPPATPAAATTTDRDSTESEVRTRTLSFTHRRSHSLQAFSHPQTQQSGHEQNQPPSPVLSPATASRTGEQSQAMEPLGPWRQRLGIRVRHLSDQPFPLARRVKEH